MSIIAASFVSGIVTFNEENFSEFMMIEIINKIKQFLIISIIIGNFEGRKIKYFGEKFKMSLNLF